jgi:hypothetical protein
MNGEFAGAKAPRGTRVALSGDGAWAFVTRASARLGFNDADSLPGTLVIVDLSDASQPRIAAKRPLEGRGETEYPVVTNGRQVGVLLGYAGGLLILDVRDPRRPLTVAHQQLPPMHAAWGLALDEKHVYVGAGESGMLIYSLPQRYEVPVTSTTRGCMTWAICSGVTQRIEMSGPDQGMQAIRGRVGSRSWRNAYSFAGIILRTARSTPARHTHLNSLNRRMRTRMSGGVGGE